jgi:hypothetical protein
VVTFAPTRVVRAITEGYNVAVLQAAHDALTQKARP